MNQDDAFRRLTERLDTYRQEMIDLQRQLVCRVAVGPEKGGPGEGGKAAFLQRFAGELGPRGGQLSGPG